MRYVKKPVEIEAVQWLGYNLHEMYLFTHLFAEIATFSDEDRAGGYTAEVYDEKHSTWIKVRTGDFIIKGIDGEFYPCAQDVFRRTYDFVAED